MPEHASDDEIRRAEAEASEKIEVMLGSPSSLTMLETVIAEQALTDERLRAWKVGLVACTTRDSVRADLGEVITGLELEIRGHLSDPDGPMGPIRWRDRELIARVPLSNSLTAEDAAQWLIEYLTKPGGLLYGD